MSLPCWPSMKSLPSPPSRRSSPLPPRIVSLPAPPSTVILISAARLPVALKRVVAAVHVDDEVLGGADVEAERRRVDAVEAHARAVGGDGEDLGAVAAVDFDGVDAGAAFDQVGVVARVPDHAVVAGLAEHLVVAVAAGQRRRCRRRRTGGRCRPCRAACRCRSGRRAGRAPEPPVSTSLPAPPNRLARGQRAVGLVERDGVVAAQAEDLDQRGVGDRRRAAEDGDRAAVDQDVAGGVAADDDRVVAGVAEDAQQARARNERRR